MTLFSLHVRNVLIYHFVTGIITMVTGNFIEWEHFAAFLPQYAFVILSITHWPL